MYTLSPLFEVFMLEAVGSSLIGKLRCGSTSSEVNHEHLFFTLLLMFYVDAVQLIISCTDAVAPCCSSVNLAMQGGQRAWHPAQLAALREIQ
jgi:hypothetical protein